MKKIWIILIFIPFALSAFSFFKKKDDFPSQNIRSGRISIWGNQGEVPGFVDYSDERYGPLNRTLRPDAPFQHIIADRPNEYIGFECNDNFFSFEYLHVTHNSFQSTKIPMGNRVTKEECEELIYAAILAKEDRQAYVYIEKNSANVGNASVYAVKYRGKIIYPPNVTPEIELKVMLEDMLHLEDELQNVGNPPCQICPN